jgi:hypothetical protein
MPRLARGARRASASTAVTIIVAAAVFWAGFDGGGYSVAGYTTLAIVVWGGITCSAAAGIAAYRPGRLGGIVGVALVAFAAWAATSWVWASARDDAYDETVRIVLYLGVFVAAVMAAARFERSAIADGLMLAVVGLVLLGLADRLLAPNAVPTLLETEAGGLNRLSWPIGYWNGFAVMASFGVPLLLRLIAHDERQRVRAAAVAAFPVLGAVLYLTSSRGGVVVAGFTTVAALTLTERRRRSLVAALIGGAAALAAVLFIRAQQALVNLPSAHAALWQGREATAVVVAAAVAAGLLYLIVERRIEAVRVTRRAIKGAVAAVVLVILVAIVVSNPKRRFEAFKQPPVAAAVGGTNATNAHLLSGSGNGRWQYWVAAFGEFRAHPLVGGGAGSFHTYWNRHRTIAVVIRDAHSFYFQELGELGVVGLILGGGAIWLSVAGSVAAARFRRRDAGATAAFAAIGLGFAVALALDWVWQLPIVPIVAVVALGTALTPGAEFVRPAAVRERVTTAAAAAACVAASFPPLLGAMWLNDSRAAVAAGHVAAARADARRVAMIVPWSADGRLQLALIDERAGLLGRARDDIAAAIRLSPDDWTLWIVQARLETLTGAVLEARRSLEQARVLNPLAAPPR